MACDWDGCEKAEYIGEKNIKDDRARSVERKN